MREYRSSGSVEGVKGNHDSYSDLRSALSHCEAVLFAVATSS